MDQLATPQGAAGHRALPHGRARRTSRSLHRLRTYDQDLLQLVSKQALSKMSGQRAPALAEGARAGTAAHSLCARRLHAAAELAPLALQNKRLIYNLLFHPVQRPCLSIARDPRHLGAEIGFFSVLHSWNQRLQFHLRGQINCRRRHGSQTMQDGSPPGAHSFFPSASLVASFAASSPPDSEAHSIEVSSSSTAGCCLWPNRVHSPAWLRVLFRHDWVVYSKRPFGGPEQVLRYLGAYTHRVAISNSRLVALSAHNVIFRSSVCARQQEAAHAPGCRSVSAPLSVTRAAARFRTHPQLRLPRQPQTRYSPSPVPSPPWRLRGKDSSGG